MKQLTTEQAIKFAKSKVYENWSFEQIVRFQLFQNKLCMDFNIFFEAIGKVLGRAVFSHELGINKEEIILEYLGEKEAPTLDEILELIPEDKRIVIGI